MTLNNEKSVPTISVGADMEQTSQTTEQIITNKGNDRKPKLSLEVISLDEILDSYYPPVEPVINNLLYPGVVILAGSPKIGKSFLVAEIAYRVAKGEPLSLTDEINALSTMLDCVTLDASCIAEYEKMRFEAKEKFVREVFKDRIDKGKPFYNVETRKRKDGTEYTLYRARPVGEKNFISNKTYEGLVEELYNYYSGNKKPRSLEEVFHPATVWKSKRNVTGKTIREYINTWNKYVAGHPIAKMKVNAITVKMWRTFYTDLCTDYKLTYKQVQNIRNVISYVMAYCIEEELIKYNTTRDVDYKSLPYAKTSARKDKVTKIPFTREQTAQIIAWCDEQLKRPDINPLHPLGIKFGLKMGFRYGELRGLRWENVDFAAKTIQVDDQLVQDYEINEDLTASYRGRQSAGHIKGYEEASVLPLPKDAAEVLEKIKALGYDSEYVFPAEKFRYNTFNDKVKEAANASGLNGKKYSSHCLRATAATNLYLQTHDVNQVQRLMHHTTSEMSMKYIKDMDINEKLRESLEY